MCYFVFVCSVDYYTKILKSKEKYTIKNINKVDKTVFYTIFRYMKEPVLSIIIPMYNTAPYIRQCLDSIIVQNGFPDFQVIVIDDGSNDNGADIVQEYSLKHSNIELYKQKNQGVSAARNRGLDVARGEFISFVDADDMVGVSHKVCDKYLYRPTMNFEHGNMMYRNGIIDNHFPSAPLGDTYYFKRMIDSARRNGAEIAMGGKVGVKHSESKITALLYDTNRVFDTKLKDKKIMILQAYDRESANFAVYKRDFLKQHNLRFEIDMPLDEDILFCMLATLHAKKISTICDSIYYYNRRSGSLTDYESYMSSAGAKHRFSTSLIQLFGSFLMNLAKYPEYAEIYKKYMHEFATYSYEAVWGHSSFYPGAYCNFCSENTCENCEHLQKNIKGIRKGLKKLMPNRIQKTK